MRVIGCILIWMDWWERAMAPIISPRFQLLYQRWWNLFSWIGESTFLLRNKMDFARQREWRLLFFNAGLLVISGAR